MSVAGSLTNPTKLANHLGSFFVNKDIISHEEVIAIKQALGVKVYFAKPYHSWERGTNENRNGVVRKVLPKGRSLDDITEEEMRRIDYMLNDRPLRRLNWRTPREAFAGLILRHMSDAV